MSTPRHQPTLVDVAQAAGVSRATASRVLLGRGRFSEASREAVEKAAAALGYVPNVMASDLASKNALPTVGLLLRDATNPAYGLLFSCLQEQARRHELTMVTMTVVGDPDNTLQMDSIRRLLGLRVRALVVSTGSVPSEDLAPHAQDVWMIRAGRPEPQQLINAVSYDEEVHGALLADHVWAMGHRRVLVGPMPRHVSLPEFYRGRAMVDRLTELGAHVDVLDIGEMDERAAAVASVDRARGEGLTCVMCPSDLRLLAVMRHACEQGIEIGRDLSATGCDGILPGTDVMGPTTVRLPVEAVARATIENLARGITPPTVHQVQERMAGMLVPGRTVDRHA